MNLLLLALSALILSPAAGQTSTNTNNNSSNPSALRRSGDVLQVALPATAMLSQLIERDWKGARRFALSLGVATATTFSLKRTVGKTRPDELDRHSFPSGHSMFSFSGASFLATEYGPKVGLPAFLAASFVGYTRIRTNRHYSDDVIAGAGIGMISNWIFAAPEVESGPYRAEFEYAAVYTHRFDTKTDSLPGVEFHRNPDSPRAATARVKLEWQGNGPHQIGIYWAPLEVQGLASAETGIRPLDYHELTVRYRRHLVDKPRFSFYGGAAVSGRETRVTGSPLENKLIDREFTPLLSTMAEWRFRPKLGALGEVDGIYWVKGQYSASSKAVLRWYPKTGWNVDVGLRSFVRNRQSHQLSSQVNLRYLMIGIGRSF